MTFLQDLEVILYNYLKKYNFKFYLFKKQISLKKVFSDHIDLFIFNKENILKSLIQQHNQTYITFFHTEILYLSDYHSYYVLHNLPRNSPIYQSCLMNLAQSILADNNIIYENKKIILDNLYILKSENHINRYFETPDTLITNNLTDFLDKIIYLDSFKKFF